MTMINRPMYAIPSVKRSVRVLSLLVEGRSDLSLTEVSRRLSIPKTTAFRILRTLVHEGMVETRDGKFRVGPRLVQLSLGVLQECPPRETPRLAIETPISGALHPFVLSLLASPEKESGGI